MHEPYLIPGNSVLFGKPIDWNTRYHDHAFLKAIHRHAGTLLNNAGFIHLVRHPVMVAKNEWLREQLLRKLHIPFVNYHQR